jgi:hypothetical protein
LGGGEHEYEKKCGGCNLGKAGLVSHVALHSM